MTDQNTLHIVWAIVRAAGGEVSISRADLTYDSGALTREDNPATGLITFRADEIRGGRTP